MIDGTIQTLFKKREIIAIPRQWSTVLEEHNLSKVEVCWVTLAMIKDLKSFLRLRYVSRNEDIELQLVYHPESVFVRFQINPKEVPRKISFARKKQVIDLSLRPELPPTLREERKPVREDVKRSCVRLAQKYLSLNAVRFYQSLVSTDELDDDYEVP